MRKKIVAGNWKMNKLYVEGLQLVADIMVKVDTLPDDQLVILCPPFIHLPETSRMIKSESHIKLGAQNCHYNENGAFTGEVSAPMLSSIPVNYVITGHSERRQLFNETNEVITKKVQAILSNGLKVIFCCGEPLEERKQGNHISYVEQQIKDSLFDLSAKELSNVVIAYEPIWAIGTGETASPEQAQEMHQVIRKLISEKFGNEVAEDKTILYGGSVKPDNATELFSQPDVDGGLIGGASLKADDFVKIIRSMS